MHKNKQDNDESKNPKTKSRESSEKNANAT